MPFLSYIGRGARALRAFLPAGGPGKCAPFLLLGAVVSGSLAAEPLRLESDRHRYPLGRHLEILEDPAGRLDFGAVRALPDSAWQWSESEIPNFTFSSSVYWIRIRIRNPGGIGREMLLELASARHDYIDAYVEIVPGEFEIIQTGDRRPFQSRQHHHRHFLFDTPVPAGKERAVYIRLESHDGLHESIPLVLWEPENFHRNDALRQQILGLLLGVLLIMAIYNLFITVSLLDLSYFYYVLFLFALLLWFFAHHGFAAMFWPDAPHQSNLLIPLSTGLALLLALLFARSYLGLKKRSRPLDRTMLAGTALVTLNILLALAGFYSLVHFIFYGLAAATTLIIALAGSYVLFGRYGPARFMLWGQALMLIGGLAAVSRDAGFLAHNLYTENALVLGLFSGAVVLSLGLAERINLLRVEKEKAERETLIIQNELELARQIQRSLLPERPPRVPGLEIAVRYQPMENVGGDFYDFHVQDGRLAALMADVSGHGIPAALIVSIVKIAFAQQVARVDDPPAVLGGMNGILDGNVGNEFVTAGYAFIDPVARKLITGNAGHPALLIWKRARGELARLRPYGQLLGLLPAPVWEPEEIALESGDRILLYTDGVYEAENEAKEAYGMERLEAFMRENAALSGDDFVGRFMRTLNDWSGGPLKVHDDIALVCIDVL